MFFRIEQRFFRCGIRRDMVKEIDRKNKIAQRNPDQYRAAISDGELSKIEVIDPLRIVWFNQNDILHLAAQVTFFPSINFFKLFMAVFQTSSEWLASACEALLFGVRVSFMAPSCAVSSYRMVL